MSSRDLDFRIQDILKAIKKIEDYVEGMTASQFKKNELVVDAVVRNLEIIGEASRNLTQSFKRLHPSIEWNKIIAMRNILIHEYFGVDVNVVWYTVNNHLPTLKSQLESVLSDEV